MSGKNLNHPSKQQPPDRSVPQKKKTNSTRNEQKSEDVNRNEERIAPSAHNSASQQWNQRSKDINQATGRNETTGSNVPGSEIADRNRQQSSDADQKQMGRQERSYTGNAERSGQQYSEEGNSSQQNQTNRSQKKDQLDKSHGTGSEFSERERRQNARGMNSPGMKNDQEMNRSEKRNLTEKRDRKTDLTDGEE